MKKLKTNIRDWVIYKITNPSGSYYIGKTVDLNKRLRHYKKPLCVSQKLLYRSIVKYGFKSHTVDIIDSFTGTSEYASGKELFWIRSYMSNKNKYQEQKGLNLTDGGEGVLGNKLSIERKKRIGEMSKGRIPWNKGIVMSDESRANMVKGSKYKVCLPKRKKISIYDIHGNFIREVLGITEAARQLNIVVSMIEKQLSGQVNNPRKYIFKYTS